MAVILFTAIQDRLLIRGACLSGDTIASLCPVVRLDQSQRHIAGVAVIL